MKGFANVLLVSCALMMGANVCRADEASALAARDAAADTISASASDYTYTLGGYNSVGADRSRVLIEVSGKRALYIGTHIYNLHSGCGAIDTHLDLAEADLGPLNSYYSLAFSDLTDASTSIAAANADKTWGDEWLAIEWWGVAEAAYNDAIDHIEDADTGADKRIADAEEALNDLEDSASASVIDIDAHMDDVDAAIAACQEATARAAALALGNSVDISILDLIDQQETNAAEITSLNGERITMFVARAACIDEMGNHVGHMCYTDLESCMYVMDVMHGLITDVPEGTWPLINDAHDHAELDIDDADTDRDDGWGLYDNATDPNDYLGAFNKFEDADVDAYNAEGDHYEFEGLKTDMERWLENFRDQAGEFNDEDDFWDRVNGGGGHP